MRKRIWILGLAAALATAMGEPCLPRPTSGTSNAGTDWSN